MSLSFFEKLFISFVSALFITLIVMVVIGSNKRSRLQGRCEALGGAFLKNEEICVRLEVL
jgi:hypothetical protein